MLMGVPKRDSADVAFTFAPPAPAAIRNHRDYDPNIVAVQLRHEQEDDQEFGFNMLMSKEYAQKLGLMAGDRLMPKITKEV